MRIGSRLRVLLSLLVFLAASTTLAAAPDKDITPIPMIEGIKMLEPGAPAPMFSVKDTQGVPFNLEDEKGKKPVVIVFWSIFCEPCRFEMPIIQKVHDKYAAAGLTVVTVALDGEPLKGSIDGFVKQEGYTFRVLIDELDAKEMFKVADPYGVAGTPTIFVVDRGGVVALSKAGRFKEDELEKVIQAVLKK